MGRPSIISATFEALNCDLGSYVGCQSTLTAGRCSIAEVYLSTAKSFMSSLYLGRRCAIVHLSRHQFVCLRTPLKTRGTHVKIKDTTINILALFITNMPLPRGLLGAGCAVAMVAIFSSGLVWSVGRLEWMTTGYCWKEKEEASTLKGEGASERRTS